MNTSLYRKYRSSSFSEVIGQKLIKKILLNSIKLKRISHAYIFSGPHGVGKTSISRIFAKAINCTNNVEGDCCNECSNCKSVNDLSTNDLIELDAASHNGVNDVREMIENIHYLPQKLSKKIYIIDEVQMLSNSAWNALLKTIEDPPKHVIFIFATTELSKIPLTIVSRCQKYDFQRISVNKIQSHLKGICGKEKFNIDEQALRVLATAAKGSLRDSLSMLDQLVNCNWESKIIVKDVENLFGLTSIETRIKILNYIISKNLLELSDLFNELESQGINFLFLCKELLEIIIDKIIYLKTNSIKNLKSLSQINIDSFTIPNNFLYQIVDILQAALQEIRINNDEKFFFEIAIWKCVDLFEKDIKIISSEIENDKENTQLKQIINLDNKKVEVVYDQNNSNLESKENTAHNVNLDEVLNVRKIENSSEYNEFYELKQVSFDKKEKDYSKIDSNELEQIFFQIAYNNKNEIRSSLNKNLEILREEGKLLPIASYFIEALKILIASNNGMVLLFEDDLSADNLNKIAKTKNFVSYIKEKFNKIYYVVGLSREQAKKFSENYKANFKKKFFQDCSIISLEELINDEKSVRELAMEIFKEELEEV